jgi:hypothetical protein
MDPFSLLRSTTAVGGEAQLRSLISSALLRTGQEAGGGGRVFVCLLVQVKMEETRRVIPRPKPRGPRLAGHLSC